MKKYMSLSLLLQNIIILLITEMPLISKVKMIKKMSYIIKDIKVRSWCINNPSNC